MYCPQCGQANDDDVKYCTQCGNNLERYREEWWEGRTPPSPPDAEQPREEGATTGATSEPTSGVTGGGAYRASPGSTQPGYPPPGHTQPGYPPPGYPPPYAQPYPPAYGVPPYQQPPLYRAIPNIPSYMGWAIATLILCFWPTGIVAVVYASKVGNRLAVGDVLGAQEASRKAKMWCWITFGIGIAWVVIAVIAAIAVAVIGASAAISIY